MSLLLNLFGRTPLTRRRALWGLLLVAPNTIGLFLFFGWPILQSFRISFYEWNAFNTPRFVDIDNFQRLYHDPMFRKALINTLKLVGLVVPLEVGLSLFAAILLNQRLRGRIIFRTIYFLPVVTSTVAASIVWTFVFQRRYGLMATLLKPLGYDDLNWLVEPKLVLFPIVVVTVWQRIGFDMVLFLAGLQNVPRVLHEAAMIDGANRWQRFRHVTLPMLSPTTFLVLALAPCRASSKFWVAMTRKCFPAIS